MDGYIGLGASEKRQLCEVSGEKRGIIAQSIEKDLWMCYTLRALFQCPDVGPHLTFKGGSSLSKGWGLIKRFSEDIDIVLSREYLKVTGDEDPAEEGITSSQQKKRISRLRKKTREVIASQLVPHLEGMLAPYGTVLMDQKDEQGLTINFAYHSEFSKDKYISPIIKIELGSRSDVEPSEEIFVIPFVAEDYPKEVGEVKFRVRAVAPVRTFWEKGMLLHERNFVKPGTQMPTAPGLRMARHYYDLDCLISADIGQYALADDQLFESVLRNRKVFWAHDGQATISKGSLAILPPDDAVAEWEKDFESMRDSMFLEPPKAFGAILDSVKTFQDEFNGGGPKS